MFGTEIMRNYWVKGYRPFTMVLIRDSECYFKDYGNYISIVSFIDYREMKFSCKEEVEAYSDRVRSDISAVLGRQVYCLCIVCGMEVPKRLLNAHDTMTYTKGPVLSCGKIRDPHLAQEYDVVERYVRKTKAIMDEGRSLLVDDSPRMVVFTYVMAITIVVLYLLDRIKGLSFFGDANSLGISPESVWSNREYYRLFTYIFVHANLFHLIYNVIALSSIGHSLEERVGWFKTIFVFLFGGVAAGCISCLWKEHVDKITDVTVGASGAIYAMAGALFVYAVYDSIRYKEPYVAIIVSEAILIGSGYFISNVDMYAHIGGWLTGALFGGGFIIQETVNRRRKHRQAVNTYNAEVERDRQEHWSTPKM